MKDEELYMTSTFFLNTSCDQAHCSLHFRVVCFSYCSDNNFLIVQK